MRFKQFYLGCLAHASYYLGSEDEAVIIDPQRDVKQYLDEAETNKQKIKYIIETHSHADFVSGHLELAKKTGAEIIYGEKAETSFAVHKVKDGDKLIVGKITLTFFETPGHTLEGITVLADCEKVSPKLFTGDTLFVGDVGRPDLTGAKGFSAEEMAGFLYDSLHHKILPLPNETEIFPAHGAGSLCGKSLAKETWSTLGNQRKNNYALQAMPKEKFIKLVASGLPEVPAYFSVSIQQNLKGAVAVGDISKPKAFSAEEIDDFSGAIIDIRPYSQYCAGHFPNSLNIGLGGQFASWAGALIPIGTDLAIVANSDDEVEEAFIRLARVGHDTVKGFILIEDLQKGLRAIEQKTVEDVFEVLKEGKNTQFIDVRRKSEYTNGHAVKTINISLDKLSGNIDRLNKAIPTYLICQSGYRSSLASSILENAGFSEVYNILGGTQAWIKAELEIEKEAASAA